MLTRNQIKYIHSLRLKKNRVKNKSFIVEGERSVAELLASDFQILELYATDEWKEKNLELFVNRISCTQLQRISTLQSSNKVLAIVQTPDFHLMQSEGITLVLDNISNPGNLGTIIRVCDWFGIKRIICSLNTTDVYSPKVVQATMGSIFRINIAYLELKKYFRDINEPIYGTYINGCDIKNTHLHKNAHIVLGNEADGISKEINKFIHHRVSVPRKGLETDSLNVAVAAGILLYEFCS